MFCCLHTLVAHLGNLTYSLFFVPQGKLCFLLTHDDSHFKGQTTSQTLSSDYIPAVFWHDCGWVSNVPWVRYLAYPPFSMCLLLKVSPLSLARGGSSPALKNRCLEVRGFCIVASKAPCALCTLLLPPSVLDLSHPGPPSPHPRAFPAPAQGLKPVGQQLGLYENIYIPRFQFGPT